VTLVATRFADIATAGDDLNHVTIDVDFAPMNAMVNISISRFGTSGGTVEAGILDYRIRNDQGVDVPTSFGDLSNLASQNADALPAAVAHNNMTHITMLVITFDAWTRGMITVLATDFAQNSDQ
jgi:hypothetical protein